MVSIKLPKAPITVFDLAPAPGQDCRQKNGNSITITTSCSCPFVQRSKIALQEKSLPHKVELVDVDNKPQDFLALSQSITANPKGGGTVPIIIDGDVKLAESNVVSEYLDTAYPESGLKLFPRDPVKLAKVRLFVETFDTLVQPIGFQVLKADSHKALDEKKDAYSHGLLVLDSFLRSHGLPGGDFLLGDEFSYAEVAAIPFIYRFNKALVHYRNFDPMKIIADQKWDRLDRWIQAGLERQSFKDTLGQDKDTIGRLSKYFNPL